MNTPKDFLKDKGIIAEGFDDFIISYPDGSKISVNVLLDEYGKLVEESIVQAITDPENQPSQYGTVLM